jgi:uncharacterized protein YjbI with pentapeptide repeats
VGRAALLCLLINIHCLDHLDAQTRTPPDRMAFQSYLTDINGDPMGAAAPVNKTLKFIIYEAEQGPDSKWAEQQVVTVNNGHFSVILGEGTRLNDSSDQQLPFAEVFAGTGASDRFIELTVVNESGGSDQVLLPRLRLLPSPYAFMASKVASLDLTDTDVLEGQLGGGNIADSAINSAKILNETIQSADIKDGAITSSDIASNTIASANIKDESVTSADITNSTIVSADIKDSTIVSADIKDSTIVSADIANSTIVSGDIKDGSLEGRDIKSKTITGSNIGGGAYVSGTNSRLRIIRGYVLSNGVKAKGELFTSTKQSTGKYRITFDSSAFTDYPIVTVSAYGGGDLQDNVVNIANLGSDGMTVYITDSSPDKNVAMEDCAFMFIAIGTIN